MEVLLNYNKSSQYLQFRMGALAIHYVFHKGGDGVG